MDLRRALETAEAAAVAAGEILLRDFHRPGGARGHLDKAEADVEAEAVVRERLTAAFPRWGYLGEETGRRAGDPGQPIWLVDPNDGTRDYLKGFRGSAVSIALVLDGRPVLGVVHAFAHPDDHGDLFAWAEGEPALRRNGRPATTRLPDALAPRDVILVSSQGDRDPEQNLEGASPARYRCVPSIAHRLALVAAGEAAGTTSLHSPGAWDYAAGHALLRAVNGALVDQDGRAVGYAPDGTSRCEKAFGASPAVAALLRGRDWRLPSPETRHPFARLVRGEAVADAGRLSRAQGCLLGQVAGDNLGALVEFASAAEIAARHPDGPRELVDGGRWDLLAGQPTDDSELALALARSILAAGGYDPEHAFAAYREWYAAEPFDVGQTIGKALRGRPDPTSQANGSLMRASPLAVLACGLRPEEAVATARADSRLTHPHPVCGDAVAAFVLAVRHALREGDGPQPAWRAALDWARESADRSVAEALERAKDAAPVCDGASQGFVLVALQNAFHALLHAASLEDGVVATVRRGGDTDTNAAIAGALLGAVHGRGALPPSWRSAVLSCRAHPRVARRPRPQVYWPVDVHEIAERLLLAGSAARNSPSRKESP